MNILECTFKYVPKNVIVLIYMMLLALMTFLLLTDGRQVGFPDWAYYVAIAIIFSEFICYYIRLAYDRDKLKCCSINKDVESSDLTHGVVIFFISGPLLVALLLVLVVVPASVLVSVLNLFF